MSPAEKPQHERLGLLIVGALERASVFEIRRKVLERALADAGLAVVPDTLEELTFFVSGPLYEHAQKALGDAFADAMLTEMTPVLDRAWELDRAAVEEPFGADTPTSAIRSKRSKSAIRRMSEEDGPPSAVDVAYDPADTVPARDTDRVPPSSKRNTMPYVESVLTSDSCRVLVADADNVRRLELTRALEDAGHSVVTAPDARVASLLTGRVHPSIIVADIETVAPDFEPLGPALEVIFGDTDAVDVILMSDHRRPDLPAAVKAILSETCTPAEMLDVVERVRRG